MNKNDDTISAINRLTRRIDNMQATIDVLVNKDKTRELMLEEVLASLASLKQFTITTREHHDVQTADVKSDIKDTEIKVAQKIEKIGEQLDKKQIIRLPSKGILTKLLFFRR